MREDLVYKVIADSFDGRRFAEDFAEQLLEERKNAKLDVNAMQFYEWCQSNDWETIVDLDTKALLLLSKSEYLFCKSIEQLNVPILMLGSREDEMCRDDMEDEYRELITLIDRAEMKIFESGKHLSILSNTIEIPKTIIKYVNNMY